MTITKLGGIIVDNNNSQGGVIEATIGSGGVINSLTIQNPGYGYDGISVDIGIESPQHIGVGIGTKASALASIVNGSLSNPITITNPGYGYTIAPKVLVPLPKFKVETISNINTEVEGFSGIITGITTTTGTSGNPLALKFFLRTQNTQFTTLYQGYPIFIFNTTVGTGVTSINTSNNSTVGIGTSFLDNVYYIHSITRNGINAEIVTNVKSNSNVVGINTRGTINNPIGRFSWGRFYGFSRSKNPISIGVSGFTVDSGLSTFPSIQRRGYGIRNTGSLKLNLDSFVT
jgi:hypothetical protein